MKKTTYILGAILGAALILSFFLPAILFRETDYEDEGYIDITVNDTTKRQPEMIELEQFSHLFISLDNDKTYLYIYEENTDNPIYPFLNIEVSDSVASPKLAINACWKDVLRVYVADNMMGMILNPDYFSNREDEGEDSALIPWYSVTIHLNWDCAEIGTLYVPKDMLLTIDNNNLALNLFGFTDSYLDMHGHNNPWHAYNCSFETLNVE